MPKFTRLRFNLEKLKDPTVKEDFQAMTGGKFAATSAVLLNGNRGDWFHTTVGVRQGCILSPTLFNIFVERIMNDALEDHEGTVSIGGRTITNLRFVDDIDGLAGNEEELASLVEHLDKASSAFGMEISAEKTKLMANNPQGITIEIKINGIKLDPVKTFKYLVSTISDEGSRPEILARIAQTTTMLTKLQSIWRDKNIRLRFKIHQMCSLGLSVFLYACESWTLTKTVEHYL
uniref:Reverse transcriptase domain-containing protein n=1 Tax=Hippocampus comes TaxID=109280 RepID=A0A3Q2YQH1_HIPCM